MLWSLLGTVIALVSASRPPPQTHVQAQVQAYWEAKAPARSEADKSWIMKTLNSTSFRNAIVPLHSIATRSDAELFNMLLHEISLTTIIHNIKWGTSFETALDQDLERHNLHAQTKVDVPTVMSVMYVPNVWELIANGSIRYDEKQARGLDKCEIDVLHFPTIAIPNVTVAGARDRPVYAALNVWKRAGGNFEFGEVGFVMREQELGNISFWSPMDTGWYCYGCLQGGGSNDTCKAWDHASFGTRRAWYHILRPHLEFWGRHLQDLFLRWYGGLSLFPVTSPHLYMEVEIAGSFLVPELLKFLCVQSGLFGLASGGKLRHWASHVIHRPLAWAHDYNSKMVVDAIVGQIDGVYHITDADRNEIAKLWNETAPFGSIVGSTNGGLHIHFLDHLNAAACEGSQYRNTETLGVNSNNDCLFYRS